MSAFECCEEQRESLRAALKDQTSVADQVYAIRHALMQTEQHTLAQQSDEVLRQQMGVLFSLVKGSVGFLETPVAATSWVAQSRKAEKQGGKAWLVVLTALLMIFSGLCCYFRGIVLGWVSALAALIAGSAALLTERRKGRKAAGHDEVRVTLQRTLNGCWPFWTGSYALSTAAPTTLPISTTVCGAGSRAVPPWRSVWPT